MEISETKIKLDKALQKLCICFGILGILNTLATFYFTSINLGTAFPGLIGLILLIYGLFYYKIQELSVAGFGKYLIGFLKIGFIAWLISFIAVCVMLINNAAHSPMANADAVIVLGAGLNGDQVSQTLAFRLDKAMEYYSENGQPPIVVSGGQGGNELVPEAVAMENYLIAKGIPAAHITKEAESHNTRQNFEYSKALLDTHFKGEEYNIVYVTNQFHTYRAGLLAEKAGLQADGLGAPTSPALMLNQYFREYFSLIKYALIDSRA